MKKILFLCSFFALILFTNKAIAQNAGPSPSPAAKIVQTIGTTEFTVSYSRPSMKERKIMGELVPFDAVWRTGANSATKFSVNKDITVEGKPLPAGDYALLTKPGKTSWEIHFHKFDQAAVNGYMDKAPFLNVKVTPLSMGDTKIESFMIMFDELRDTSASMGIGWESTYVPITLGVK